MTNKQKAKRHITEFDFNEFDEYGVGIHLVGDVVGGPANGIKTLIKKSKATKDFPDVEDVNIQKKLEQVQVTMSMEDFLKRFFYLHSEDAELLTAMLGLKTEFESYLESVDSEPMDYASFIAEKVSGFEIMKSMYEGEEIKASALDMVTILETQEKIEKQLKEETMDNVTIKKSRLAELEDAEGKLSTNLDLVKSLETEKKELENEIKVLKQAQADKELSVMKQRLEGLVDEAKIEKMAASLVAMDEEVANDMIDNFKAKQDATEESDLFVEKSKSGEPEDKSDEEVEQMKFEKAYRQAMGLEDKE